MTSTTANERETAKEEGEKIAEQLIKNDIKKLRLAWRILGGRGYNSNDKMTAVNTIAEVADDVEKIGSALAFRASAERAPLKELRVKNERTHFAVKCLWCGSFDAWTSGWSDEDGCSGTDYHCSNCGADFDAGTYNEGKLELKIDSLSKEASTEA